MAKRWILAVLTAALVALAGCGSNQGLTDTDDCDYLVVPTGGETIPDTTDRCTAGPLAIDFAVEVFFRGPEEGLGEIPEPTTSSLFRLKYYDVEYKNLLTGRTTAGIDVPFPTRVSIEAVFNLAEEEQLDLEGFEVLEAGAKQEAPLNDSSFYTRPSGIPMVAHLTFWGHPITNPDAWCYGEMDWYFTVFSTC